MEKWTFFLAEEEVENPTSFKDSLPGAERVLPRVWLYPGHPAPGNEKRALPYGEHPAYGRVYARPVAMGSGLEGLRSHPLGQRAKEHYRQRFLERYAQGQLSEADALRAQAQRLGLWEEEPGLLQRAVELQRHLLLLRSMKVPVRLVEGRVVLEASPALELTPEEVELTYETYAWARREGLTAQPLGRREGQLLFGVNAVVLPVRDGKVQLEVARRNGQGKEPRRMIVRLFPVGGDIKAAPILTFPPKKVKLRFLSPSSS